MKKLILFFLFLSLEGVSFCQSVTFYTPSNGQTLSGGLYSDQVYFNFVWGYSRTPSPSPYIAENIQLITESRTYNSADEDLPGSFSLTPGTYTWTLRLVEYDIAQYPHLTASQTITFYVKAQVTVKNSFTYGTINVDGSSRNSPFNAFKYNNEQIQSGAIDQTYNGRDYVWNTSGIYNSEWNYYSALTSQNYSFSSARNTTFTLGTNNNLSTITAKMRKILHITFQNNFVQVGNGGTITVNGGTYNSPTSSFNVTELNPITAQATGGTINNIAYYFSSWSTGSTNSAETFYPDADATITANYVGIAAQSVGLNFSASNPNLPITLHWTEYPNSSVTQYQIWRRVKYQDDPTSSPQLIATVNRGTTNYTDYEYSGTNQGHTDWLLWYDVRSYYSTEGTYPDPNWVSVFSNGLLAKGLGELAVTENKIENYPNPFNPSTVIRYQLVNSGPVSIKVYDIVGREIMTLVNEEKQQGRYQVKFDASNLSSGIYFYRIVATGFTESKKMILTK